MINFTIKKHNWAYVVHTDTPITHFRRFMPSVPLQPRTYILCSVFPRSPSSTFKIKILPILIVRWSIVYGASKCFFYVLFSEKYENNYFLLIALNSKVCNHSHVAKTRLPEEEKNLTERWEIYIAFLFGTSWSYGAVKYILFIWKILFIYFVLN